MAHLVCTDHGRRVIALRASRGQDRFVFQHRDKAMTPCDPHSLKYRGQYVYATDLFRAHNGGTLREKNDNA